MAGHDVGEYFNHIFVLEFRFLHSPGKNYGTIFVIHIDQSRDESMKQEDQQTKSFSISLYHFVKYLV